MSDCSCCFCNYCPCIPTWMYQEEPNVHASCEGCLSGLSKKWALRRLKKLRVKVVPASMLAPLVGALGKKKAR